MELFEQAEDALEVPSKSGPKPVSRGLWNEESRSDLTSSLPKNRSRNLESSRVSYFSPQSTISQWVAQEAIDQWVGIGKEKRKKGREIALLEKEDDVSNVMPDSSLLQSMLTFASQELDSQGRLHSTSQPRRGRSEEEEEESEHYQEQESEGKSSKSRKRRKAAPEVSTGKSDLTRKFDSSALVALGIFVEEYVRWQGGFEDGEESNTDDEVAEMARLARKTRILKEIQDLSDGESEGDEDGDNDIGNVEEAGHNQARGQPTQTNIPTIDVSENSSSRSSDAGSQDDEDVGSDNVVHKDETQS